MPLIAAAKQKMRAGGEYYGSPGQDDDGWFWKALQKPEYRGKRHLAHASFTEYTKLKKLNLVADAIQQYASRSSLLLSNVHVLDAGCGRGTYSLALSTLGCRVLGCELNPELIAQSKERDPNGAIDFQIGDAEDFAKAGKFNIVIAMDVLEHMSEAKCASFCRSVQDSLVEHGIFLAVVPSGYGLVELYGRGITVLQKMMGVLGEHIPHEQRFTLKKAKRMMLEAGFQYRFVSSIYEGNLLTPLLLGRRRGQACWLNMKISDHLPPSMTGSWLIAGIKN